VHISRLLAEGVGSWLHFEYCCSRNGLFNERYIAQAVGQILHANYGDQVRGELAHPLLATDKPGGQPQIDYVVYDSGTKKIKFAIETKWAGSSHCTVENIVWDLIRLQMLVEEGAVNCAFLLAGRRDRLANLFKKADFVAPRGRNPILHTTNAAINTLSLLPDIPERVPLFRKIFGRHQNVKIPQFVVTQLHGPFPADGKTKHHQVFVWEVGVAHVARAKPFVPGEIGAYRLPSWQAQ
jgi:hypothetical protein